MGGNGYYLPGSYNLGEDYFIKVNNNNGQAEFNVVVFVSYRPHPGEVIVRDENRTRMVYRSDLFSHSIDDDESEVKLKQIV